MGGGGGGTLRNTQACEGAMRRSEAYISAPPFSKSLEAHSKVTRRWLNAFLGQESSAKSWVSVKFGWVSYKGVMRQFP